MDIESINRRIEALSMVMTAVISQMDKLQAARAVAHLEMATSQQQTGKLNHPGTQKEIAEFLKLLSEQSKPD